MPTYSFRDNITSNEFNDFMSMSQLDTYLKENPHIEQTITVAPALCDPTRLGLRKPDSGFRDILKKIKREANRGIKRSTINTW